MQITKLVINFLHLYIWKLLLTRNNRWRKSVNKSDDSKKFDESIERQLKPDPIVTSNCGDHVVLLGKERDNQENGVHTLVHHLPYMKGAEGRVLLTVDVAWSRHVSIVPCFKIFCSIIWKGLREIATMKRLIIIHLKSWSSHEKINHSVSIQHIHFLIFSSYFGHENRVR